jgi:hypothetical protein
LIAKADAAYLQAAIAALPTACPETMILRDARRGLIITNRHFSDQVDRIAVKLTDGRTLAAERVGTDPSTDVAPHERYLNCHGGRPIRRRRSLN